MRCHRCQKEATVILTEPVKGQRRELHLCPNCARKAGLPLPESPPNLALDAVVQSLIVTHVGELVGELAELTCPDCGIKFMEYRAGGRLGCPRDYRVFAAGLLPLIQRFHGATRHVGKAARRARAPTIGCGSAPACARRSPGKTTRKPRGCATSSAPRIHRHDSRRPHEIIRRVAARHRPGERHRHVLSHPAGPQPRRLPLHQPRQPRREVRDRGPLPRRARARPARPVLSSTSTAWRRSTGSSWSSARSSPASCPPATAPAASRSARRRTSRSWSTRRTISASSSCSRASGCPRSGTRSTSSTTSSRSTWPTPISPQLGYLTACPTNVGTGIRVGVMLHLPGLVQTKQIDKVFRALQKINLAVRGLYGEGSQASGDFYQISNQQTLGKSRARADQDPDRRRPPGPHSTSARPARRCSPSGRSTCTTRSAGRMAS